MYPSCQLFYSSLSHEMQRITIVKVKTVPAILTEIIRFDQQQIETRLSHLALRIISRRRPRATEESSKEIYRHFHFDNCETPLYFF